jgi:hypothetical protein
MFGLVCGTKARNIREGLRCRFELILRQIPDSLALEAYIRGVGPKCCRRLKQLGGMSDAHVPEEEI